MFYIDAVYMDKVHIIDTKDGAGEWVSKRDLSDCTLEIKGKSGNNYEVVNQYNPYVMKLNTLYKAGISYLNSGALSLMCLDYLPDGFVLELDKISPILISNCLWKYSDSSVVLNFRDGLVCSESVFTCKASLVQCNMTGVTDLDLYNSVVKCCILASDLNWKMVYNCIKDDDEDSKRFLIVRNILKSNHYMYSTFRYDLLNSENDDLFMQAHKTLFEASDTVRTIYKVSHDMIAKYEAYMKDFTSFLRSLDLIHSLIMEDLSFASSATFIAISWLLRIVTYYKLGGRSKGLYSYMREVTCITC